MYGSITNIQLEFNNTLNWSESSWLDSCITVEIMIASCQGNYSLLWYFIAISEPQNEHVENKQNHVDKKNYKRSDINVWQRKNQRLYESF